MDTLFKRVSIPVFTWTILLSLILTANTHAEPLVFLNWEDYIDPEVLADFHTETGIEVTQSYFEADEERDAHLINSEGKGYDLILVSGLMVESYVRNGWIEALPADLGEELSTIDRRWWNAFPAAEWYAVPYFWGTLGIAYRSDIVDSSIDSWMDIFQPSEQLQGKIAVLDSTRDTTGMALKALGYSLNTRKSLAFKEAITLLQAQGPHVGFYGLVDLDETSRLLSGDILAAMMFSGDALMLQDINEDIEYVLPKEGGNLWVDYITVSSSSTNKEAAWKFIKYLNKPEIAARQANFVYYAPPNNAALPLMDADFLDNKTIFPSKKALANSEFLQPLLPRYLKALDDQYQALMLENTAE
jgi:spermidine/putrescine transport system substrate-binding protein